MEKKLNEVNVGATEQEECLIRVIINVSTLNATFFCGVTILSLKLYLRILLCPLDASVV